jgi:hypothetical protein
LSLAQQNNNIGPPDSGNVDFLSKHFAAASNPASAPFRPTPLAALPPVPPLQSAAAAAAAAASAADYASWLCRPMAGYLPLNPSNLLAARLAGKYLRFLKK